MKHQSFDDWLRGAGRWGIAAEAFDREHPEVYANLVEFARALLFSGYKRYGIGGLFEALRYEKAVRMGPSAQDLSFNNNYRAYFSRKIMDREPDLEGFFLVRELRSEREG